MKLLVLLIFSSCFFGQDFEGFILRDSALGGSKPSIGEFPIRKEVEVNVSSVPAISATFTQLQPPRKNKPVAVGTYICNLTNSAMSIHGGKIRTAAIQSGYNVVPESFIRDENRQTATKGRRIKTAVVKLIPIVLTVAATYFISKQNVNDFVKVGVGAAPIFLEFIPSDNSEYRSSSALPLSDIPLAPGGCQEKTFMAFQHTYLASDQALFFVQQSKTNLQEMSFEMKEGTTVWR